MFRQLAVLAVLAVAAFAYPIENFDDIPAEYKSLIPEEVAGHLKSITPEEKAILKELAKRHGEFKNEEEFLVALKEKSETLHEKAMKLHTMIKTKVDALGEEARTFVKAVIAKARKIHAAYLAGNKPSLSELKVTAKEQIEAYNKLSEGAKDDFKREFPLLTGFFTNPKVKALAEKYLADN